MVDQNMKKCSGDYWV